MHRLKLGHQDSNEHVKRDHDEEHLREKEEPRSDDGFHFCKSHIHMFMSIVLWDRIYNGNQDGMRGRKLEDDEVESGDKEGYNILEKAAELVQTIITKEQRG